MLDGSIDNIWLVELALEVRAEDVSEDTHDLGYGDVLSDLHIDLHLGGRLLLEQHCPEPVAHIANVGEILRSSERISKSGLQHALNIGKQFFTSWAFNNVSQYLVGDAEAVEGVLHEVARVEFLGLLDFSMLANMVS
jgi:hypothetical protein